MASIVLVGAGHAQLHTLKHLAGFTARGHTVTLVAPGPFWYSGLATGVLGGHYPERLDQVDVACLAERGGGTFVQDHVTRIDRTARRLVLAGGDTLSYDLLSLTTGSEVPPLPGTEGHPRCFTVKPIPRLMALKAALEERFRRHPSRGVVVLVAGGGVTACELAANILALAAARGGRVLVTVLAGSEPLRQLPPKAARQVVADLERRGIAFRVGDRVGRVEGVEAVMAGGDRLPFDLFLNATGLRPGPVAQGSGLPLDKGGALVVDDRLRSPADPGVFGAGDGVALDGHELPKVGVYAIRQAPILCHNLLAAAEGKPLRRFVPQRDYLWIMNLGDRRGLAVRGSLWWAGRSAWWLKDRIDRRFLETYAG